MVNYLLRYSTNKSKTINALKKIRKNKYGDMIHSLMVCDEITIEELSKRTEIPVSALTEIIKCRTLPNIKTAKKINKVLGYGDSLLYWLIDDYFEER